MIFVSIFGDIEFATKIFEVSHKKKLRPMEHT
jgi:hypothetical protein